MDGYQLEELALDHMKDLNLKEDSRLKLETVDLLEKMKMGLISHFGFKNLHCSNHDMTVKGILSFILHITLGIKVQFLSKVAHFRRVLVYRHY